MSEAAESKRASVTTGQIETLLLELWRQRLDATAVASISEKLAAAAPTELPQVEMYLPQFAHIIITLADELPTVAPLEKFVLSVCQLSIHVALKFFWLVYGALQENRLKSKKADRAVYRRCARLLLLLEQCVVYGALRGRVPSVSGGATARQRELMRECERVAALSLSGSSREGGDDKRFVISGKLRKKGGGTSRFGRRNWSERYFEVCDRVLYYYASQSDAVKDKTSPLDRPQGSLQLTTAVVDVKEHAKYPHYFEVRCTQSGLNFCLQAHSREEMVRWVLAIRNINALPEPPGMAPHQLSDILTSMVSGESGETLAGVEQERDGAAAKFASRRSRSALLAREFRKFTSSQRRSSDEELTAPSSGTSTAPERASSQSEAGGGSGVGEASMGSTSEMSEESPNSDGRAMFEYFNSQREFIRALTNLAEELRFMAAPARQEQLQPRLDALRLPPSTYLPIAHSEDPCQALLRFTPHESIVFNTKARCPIMLLCEVRREPFTVAELAERIGDVRNGSDGATGGSVPAPAPGSGVTLSKPHDESMTFREKKGETWAAKQARLSKASPLSKELKGWELASFIVKSNDDLRQEVFIMQMLRYLQSIWPSELTWLNCYHIEATGPDTGLIETITGSADLDRIKKTSGFTSLRQLFIERYGAPDSQGFLAAQDNFVRSLASYSVVMWLLQLRDRHNGNLMLDEAGHFFHIDFGFCLGHSTGKGIGGLVECSPFKLTEEYIELLDGRNSPTFTRFCECCIAAFKASHAHAQTILTIVEVVGTRSVFPCFQNCPVHKVLPRLAKRLMVDKPATAVEDAFRRIVFKAAGHWGSRQYDWCQNMQQGIAI